MILTYKYRVKDRSGAKTCSATHLRQSSLERCVAQQRRYRGALSGWRAERKWASSFDLAKQCKGVGKDLGLHQQSVAGVCEQFAAAGTRPSVFPFPRQRRTQARSRMGAIPEAKSAD